MNFREEALYRRTMLEEGHIEAVSKRLDSVLAKALNDYSENDWDFDYSNQICLRFSKNNRLIEVVDRGQATSKEMKAQFKYCKKKDIPGFK